jgi:hypothetical protein
METIRRVVKLTVNMVISTMRKTRIGRLVNVLALKHVIARHVIPGGIKSAPNVSKTTR